MIVYEIPWNILLYKRQFYVLLPRSCFSVLGQIKSIKRSLPAHTLTIVVTVLVHSRFYYCNVVFAGLPNCDIQRVKCVLNTVVRLVADASRWDPVPPCFAIINHHRLPIKQCFGYKLCITVACTAKHHVIWPTSSRRLPQRPPEQASDPPYRHILALSQCPSLGDCSFAVVRLTCVEQSAVITSMSSLCWHFQIPTQNISRCSGFLTFS